MKICLLNNLYQPTAVGGAEKAVENIAKLLVSLGHEVVVMTIGVGDYQKANLDGYQVVYLKNKFIYHRFNSSQQTFVTKIYWHWQNMFSLAHAEQVNQFFSSWQPDVVWTHNLSGFGWQVIKVINKYKIRHWHELHDFQLIDPFGTYFRSNKLMFTLLQPLYCYCGFISKKIFKSTDLVVGPSKFIIDFFEQKSFFKSAKKKVQPNPLNDKFFKSESLVQKDNSIKFLYIGQVEKQKGVEMLINIFNKLHSSQASLTILGTGEYLSQAKLANKNVQVKFLGLLNSDQVVNNILASSVILVPSICIENSPTVIAEALCLGRPVMASNVGGIPEMIKNNVNGWLLRAGDYQAWANLINKLTHEPEQLENLIVGVAESAKKYSIQEYKLWLKQNL